jgi:hypothetical protein
MPVTFNLALYLTQAGSNLAANVRLVYKGLAVTNTLAYYRTELVMTVKSSQERLLQFLTKRHSSYCKKVPLRPKVSEPHW